MKRLMMWLVVMFVSALGCMAQHFTFMDIPLDGPETAFDKELEAKGFKPSPDEEEETNIAFYRGRFMGHDVLLSRWCSPRTHIVVQVCVTFDKITDMKDNEKIYNRICRQIEKKYKIDETKKEGAYDTYYYVDNHTGAIRVGINDGMVMLFYVDVKNVSLLVEEEDQDI